MSLKDKIAARVMQVVMVRLARPPAALLVRGGDLPAPEPMVVPTDSGPVTVHVYRPTGGRGADGPGAARPPVYVNYHGGGFLLRHPEYDDHICRALVADTGCVVLNVDYDVAPQRPYPVAVDQAYAVAEWAATNGEAHGWDGARLAVGGQSAGGNLSAGVCWTARERGVFAPVLQILVYPPLDLASDPATKRSPIDKPLLTPKLIALFNFTYVSDPAQRREPLASPLLADDLAGLAPALVITAEHDLLCDEGDAYARRLAEAGVPVIHHRMMGVDHAFTHKEPVEPLGEALDVMAGALRTAWA